MNFEVGTGGGQFGHSDIKCKNTIYLFICELCSSKVCIHFGTLCIYSEGLNITDNFFKH